ASRRRPDPQPALSIVPDQLHIGDQFTDADAGDEAQEWEVVSSPVTLKKGHEVRARVQRPGNPATAREKYWAAHDKITVRRMTASPMRPTAEPDGDGTDVEGLRRDVRRLARRGPAPREGQGRAREAHRSLSARGGAAPGEGRAGDLDVVRMG